MTFWGFLRFSLLVYYSVIRIFISIQLFILLRSTIIAQTFYTAFIGSFAFGRKSFFCKFFICAIRTKAIVRGLSPQMIATLLNAIDCSFHFLFLFIFFSRNSTNYQYRNTLSNAGFFKIVPYSADQS